MDVSLIKCETYEQSDLNNKILTAVNLIGGFENLIKKNDKVFIKLNCVWPFEKEKGITTHPEFVKCIIRNVKKITSNIIVGDNPAIKDQISTLKKCGIYDILIQENVKILDQTKTTIITNSSYKTYRQFEVSKEMMDADVLINLPKLKTHSLTYMTVAEKNFFGCIYGLKKSAWHIKASNPLEFAEAINDLYGAILEKFKNKVILNICDGILGLEGEGPSSGGTCKYSNAILASLDAVSLDAVACKLVHLDNSKLFINNIAGKRNYGENDLNNIKLLGDNISSFNVNFKAPKDSLGNIGLKILKFKPLRNILLEHPVVNDIKCIKCGACVKICPAKTLYIKGEHYPHLNASNCIRCWCCQEVCPKNAIEKSKRPILGKILF